VPAFVLSEYVPSVMVDLYGDVCDMNAEAEKLLGISKMNLMNKPWNQPLKDGVVINVDGRNLQLAIMQTQTTPANYVTLNDLTAKERFKEESVAQSLKIEKLQSDLKKAQELNVTKEQYTALIAHDFGNPITSIRLQSDILKKHLSTLSPEAATQRLEQVDAQLNHMIDLLDDLRLLNQIQCTQEFTSFNLEVFSRKIIDQIKRGWQGREVIVTSIGQTDNVQVDKRLVRYILSNLVGNALKYSPDGGDVNVDIRVTEQTMTLSVRDQGIGIPDDELDRIFTQFYRASNVTEFSGLGLGLTMMKKCIEMSDGSIHVESKLDEGTTFVVSLPNATDNTNKDVIRPSI
jgi:signal transduction histidine kinase